MKIAIFPGSFDPYTIGHHDIVERVLPLFDKVVIAFGINTSKMPFIPLKDRVETLKRVYLNEPKIEIQTYDTLTVDFAKSIGAEYIIRGVRSVADFEYERNIADVNRKIADIDTIMICADPKLAVVSSSLVRELSRFGHNVDEYIVK